MATLIQVLTTGISVGIIYSLIALGIVLIFKCTGVLNLAQGEIALFSAWITYALLAQLGLPLWLGLPLVLLAAILIGLMIERFTMRPLIGQPVLALIIVTLGLVYVFRGLDHLFWPQSIAALHIFPSGVIEFGGAAISVEYIWALLVCVILFISLAVYFKYSRGGITMRATADDQQCVQACGGSVTSVFSLGWVLTCICGATGGVLLAGISSVDVGIASMALKAIAVVLLGGIDSILGCVIAGPLIGCCESLTRVYLDPSLTAIPGGLGDIVPYILIIIVMFIRPYGILGQERIERI